MRSLFPIHEKASPTDGLLWVATRALTACCWPTATASFRGMLSDGMTRFIGIAPCSALSFFPTRYMCRAQCAN